MPPVRDPIVVKAHTRKPPTRKPKPVQSTSDAAQGYGLKRAAAFKAKPQFKRDQQAAATAGVKYQLDQLKQGKHLTPIHHHENFISHLLHTVYGSPGKSGKSTAAAPRGTSLTLSGPVRAATNLGEAVALHPISTSTHTVGGLAKTALNLPGGLLHVATQSPLTTVKQIGADYAKRYGETDAQMRHRFEKQGAAPEILDALSAYGGGGAALGRLAKGSDLMTAARPALRAGGGAAKAQEVSSNLIRVLGQRQLDKIRLSRTTKAGQKASYEEDLRAPAHVITAHHANEAAGHPVEVAPLTGAGKAQRVGVAKLKSRAVQMLKSEQHRRIEQTARPVINSLSKHERRAFYAVAEGWAPADAAKAVAHLQKRKADILATRKAEGIDSVRRNVDEVHKIDQLLKHSHESFTPKVGAAVRKLHAQDVSVGFHDPALTAPQRLLTRYGPQAEHLGLKRGQVASSFHDLGYRQEGVLDFVKRVQAEAKKHGLEKPLYFPHEGDALVNNPDFASRAVGGARAVNGPKRREYKLFNRGTRDTSPEVYLTGLGRSIKRKHNWNLVADQFDHNTLPGLTNLPLGHLKAELRHRGIDPKDVAFWNPGRFRRALKDGEQPAHLKADRYGDNTTPAEELGVEQLTHAMTSATHPAHELAQSHGWSAVPKHAHDEIMAAARPSGKLARSIDIMNGKQSRALLGLNPAWNAFQVMSNAGLGALATKGKLPLRLAEQKRLYNKLSPEGKDRMDALVGEGAGTHGAQVHLGATAKGRVVGSYRNFKAKPFFDKPILGVTPRSANPLEAGFAFDRFQNKHFRRAVLVDDLKKQAKTLDPPTVERMLKNPAQAERAAQHLDSWLGDYTSYTHAERMGIKKGALFYGYLRHSLSVLLKTLPRDHPLMASILGKVGQLQEDELKKLGLSGIPWAGGKFYFTKDGQLQAIDLGRANPVANAVTQIHGVKDLVGLTQPAVQIAMDQVYHHNSFKDQSWAAYGHPGSALANMKGSYFDGARKRIFLNQIGELFPPYRVAEKMTEFGPQGADSLPWSQRPTQYKRADIVAAIKKQTAQDRKDTSFLHLMMPFLPQPSHDVQVAQSIAATTGKAKPKHKASKAKYFGTSAHRKSSTYFTGN